jgi:Homeodomain-like domain
MNSTPRDARAARERQTVRSYRVMNWLRAGFSYEEIAEHERISRSWVRRIVARALKERDEDCMPDPQVMAEIQLQPALRLAGKAIIEGKLEGIDRLVKVIDRLQRFGRARKKPVYDENARARLLAKLNRNLAKLPHPQEQSPEK